MVFGGVEGDTTGTSDCRAARLTKGLEGTESEGKGIEDD
jgi:hypothetical protein